MYNQGNVQQLGVAWDVPVDVPVAVPPNCILQVFMFIKFLVLFLFKILMVASVVLVVANRGQHSYSARGKRKLRQEDNAPSSSCEAFREYTKVPSPEAVLSHKD